MSVTIFKLNAYGMRWHVMIDGQGIRYSAMTKRQCIDYCKRHELAR